MNVRTIDTDKAPATWFNEYRFSSALLGSRGGDDLFIFLSNVKEHATLSAGASVDHGVEVKTTKDHDNRAADRGCVSRLVRFLF
jgi:hypothetical protein